MQTIENIERRVVFAQVAKDRRYLLHTGGCCMPGVQRAGSTYYVTVRLAAEARMGQMVSGEKESREAGG